MALGRVRKFAAKYNRPMPDSPQLERLLARAEAVLARLEATLPPAPQAPDWQAAVAYRWRKRNGRGWLQAVRHPHPVRLADLANIDDQKARIVANTRQFVAGRPAKDAAIEAVETAGRAVLFAAGTVIVALLA